MSEKGSKHIIIPCSGIGKGVGTVARRATYIVTDEILPRATATTCLPLLTIEDKEAVEKVRRNPCITIDGCVAQCAKKNVEYHRGNLKAAINVLDFLKQNPGLKPGSVLNIGPDGEKLANKIADKIAKIIGETN
jgi:uncharacterized metal-binding protein